MLADGLTKVMDGQAILQAVGTGEMRLVAEEKPTKPPLKPALSALCSFYWLPQFNIFPPVESSLSRNDSADMSSAAEGC
jgi:hypothetical protein